jgi:DNA-binding response OmpR family regulator
MGLLISKVCFTTALNERGAQMATAWKQLISIFGSNQLDPSFVKGNVAASDVIESGDFKINLLNRTVTLREETLQLTPEEFDVLVFLAGHPQSMVTPHTVLSTSWASSRLQQTEFLKVLLSLRRKLEVAGHGKQYLRTEPWIIYRFDPESSVSH